MKVKDATMQAYPFIEPAPDDAIKAYHPGISLRDYFAAKAMQAFLMQPASITAPDEMIAEAAYDTADAMLKAREK